MKQSSPEAGPKAGQLVLFITVSHCVVSKKTVSTSHKKIPNNYMKQLISSLIISTDCHNIALSPSQCLPFECL